MDFKVDDWIHHEKFGDGQIFEDRENKYLIRFLSEGEKLLMKSAVTAPGNPPSPDFAFPKKKAMGKPGFKIAPPKREPKLDFDNLVERFRNFFKDGFDGKLFFEHERRLKEEPAKELLKWLSRDEMSKLLEASNYAQMAERVKRVLRSRLLFPQEIMRVIDALKRPENKAPFALALWTLLYGDETPQVRFETFANLLANVDATSWTAATYFQFLATNGEQMFMKPEVTKKIANSLGIALNYKSEPNWLTYCKLQELGKRVGEELEARGLSPKSGFDVQGFIWASVKIAEGSYGPKKLP
jgi:hypothetical protein